MNIIIGERGAGKTMKLLHISAEKKIPIVAGTVGHAKFLKNKAEEYGLIIPEPIVYTRNLNERIRGTDISEVLVDDAELMLSHLLGIDINTMTISDESNMERPGRTVTIMEPVCKEKQE